MKKLIWLGAGLIAWRLLGKSGRRPDGPRVLILGGGFGGVEAARHLVAGGARVTLVDRRDYQLFTPMLTEVVGGLVAIQHIALPLAEIAEEIEFVRGSVEDVDPARREVKTDRGDVLSADHLVIALGSVSSTHGVPGVDAHALGIKSVQDAAEIANRARALVERGGDVTCVVVGGGFSGVETMAALNDLTREAAEKLSPPRKIRMIVIHPGERLLPELDAELGRYAGEELQKRGVEVMLGRRVREVRSDRVLLDDGSSIECGLAIWTAGVKPSPAVERMALPRGGGGGLAVDRACRVKGFDNVWAVGDCAEVPRGDGKTYAPTGQNATREGACVARNILAVHRGRSPRSFDYAPIGSMALVGRHAGVGRIMGIRVKGIIAWALWRVAYLGHMPATRGARVALDWLLDAFNGPEMASVSMLAPRQNRVRREKSAAPTEDPSSSQPVEKR
jgi:NADH dehydrogenase